jgi:hypothetical protein
VSAHGNVVPLRPGQRYDWMSNILTGLQELADYGEILLPDEPPRMEIEFFESNHRYKINGDWVLAVSTILDDVEPAPAVQWWAFRIGMAAIVDLVQQSKLSFGEITSLEYKPIIKPNLYGPEHPMFGLYGKKRDKLKTHLEALVQQERLDPYSVMKHRGTIGTSVHHGAETLQETGEVPDIGDYPEEDRGFIQALAKYWLDQDVEVEAQEVIVASQRFGYAGRFDKIVRLKNGARRMRDYKTSSGVYAKFDKQLTLYDLAYLEMGGEPLDGHDVVHLKPDGTYEIVPLVIDPVHALTALLKRAGDVQLREDLKPLGRKP